MTNPLDELRQINRQEKGRNAPVSTDLREPVDTAIREPARTEGRTDGSTAVLTEVSPSVSPPVYKEGRKDLREAVLTALETKRQYQGGVKATLDLSPELSTRFKRFALDHGNVTLRATLTELLEAFLEGEGY